MFHINSPLIESREIPKHITQPCRVLLKMDSLQPSGSFKIRGVGNICIKAVKEKGCNRLVTSSGGNAGLAVAYSGRELGVPVTVVVPETVSPFMRKKIQDLGAEVQIFGRAWDDANSVALQLATDPKTGYIHPFDDPAIWDGHATIIREISDHYKTHSEESIFKKKPDAVVTVVGGGGLLCGLLQGMHEIGWQDVPVIAAETDGAQSYYAAIKQDKLVTLPAITSIATTLGAKRVCEEAFQWSKKHRIVPVVVTDKMAVDACLKFADEHRTLVEPSCGAGLALLYENVPELQRLLEGKENPVILVVVCGGSAVSLEMLANWKTKFFEQQ